MTGKTARPPVWIGHVAMYTPKVAESSEFMQRIGMRLIDSGDDIVVLEMRGGTHLVLTSKVDSKLIRGSFDLMVDDLDASHEQFADWGLAPGAIVRGRIHDSFEVTEPGGTKLTFNSSHVGQLPV